MKRVVLIAGVIVVVALGALAFVAVSVPRKGVMETFAELHDTKLGSAYVRGRYDGFLNGWDISFFHRDGEGRWFSYYLAHESRRWRNAPKGVCLLSIMEIRQLRNTTLCAEPSSISF